ncbi:MAG: FAD-dependent oxidoreductase [Patescibacteria group bacterium]|nr:FAD-dependent oxidoreductase [Patescibacteria group bacterium]
MLDLLIIGGVAAGSAAAIYAARAKMNFKVIAKDLGGEVANSGEIGNYPGFNEIHGFELAQKFADQIKFNRIDFEMGVTVKDVTLSGKTFIVAATDENNQPKTYEAKAIILATGARPRPLGVPGEKELYLKGLSYCSTCDGPLYRDKVVTTIGGGNVALESILMLAGLAKKVYSINCNSEFRGERVYIEKIKNLSNVELISNAQTTKILGDQSVTGVEYLDKVTNKKKTVATQGVFIHAGIIPNTEMVKNLGVLDKGGFIEVNTRMETKISGFFAAGDVVNIPYKQITIAVGQGATALLSAQVYLNRWE